MRILPLLALLSLPSLALAEDWPQYRGPRGDGICRETINENWPAEGLKPAWSVSVGQGYASPVALKDKVYCVAMTGGKDVVYALDAATGKPLWQNDAGQAWEKDPNNTPGPRATPTIDGDAIYTYTGHGDLICRNLADGKVLWNINVLSDTGGKPPTWGESSTPLVVGDAVYVQGGVGGALAVAVNKKTGAYLWSSDKGKPGYAMPILANGQLIIAGGDAVSGLAPSSGKILWSQKWATSYDVNAATPIFAEGRLLISSGYGHGSMLLEPSANAAKKVWESKILQAKFPSPILDAGKVYGNSEGTLVCMDWKTGTKIWRSDDKIGAGGSLLRVQDKLLVLSERGQLSLVKTDGKAPETLKQFNATKGPNVWASPIISNGRLFIKGSDDLTCFDISAK